MSLAGQPQYSLSETAIFEPFLHILHYLFSPSFYPFTRISLKFRNQFYTKGPWMSIRICGLTILTSRVRCHDMKETFSGLFLLKAGIVFWSHAFSLAGSGSRRQPPPPIIFTQLMGKYYDKSADIVSSFPINACCQWHRPNCVSETTLFWQNRPRLSLGFRCLWSTTTVNIVISAMSSRKMLGKKEFVIKIAQ